MSIPAQDADTEPYDSGYCSDDHVYYMGTVPAAQAHVPHPAPAASGSDIDTEHEDMVPSSSEDEELRLPMNWPNFPCFRLASDPFPDVPADLRRIVREKMESCHVLFPFENDDKHKQEIVAMLTRAANTASVPFNEHQMHSAMELLRRLLYIN